VNVPRIKGTHTAMKSGMMAAEAAYGELAAGRTGPLHMNGYARNLAASWVHHELEQVRQYVSLAITIACMLLRLA
jgi:electron-transferring-flavoprotein dehydrogenase